MQLSNYLFFTTTCEQALNFYTACGLGKIITAVRHGASLQPAIAAASSANAAPEINFTAAMLRPRAPPIE